MLACSERPAPPARVTEPRAMPKAILPTTPPEARPTPTAVAATPPAPVADDPRWPEVVALARPTRQFNGNAGPLFEAQKAIDAERGIVDRLVASRVVGGNRVGYPRVAPADLSPGMRNALEAFRRWLDLGAAYTPIRCRPPDAPALTPSVLGLHYLGRLALAVAPPTSSAPEVRAAAALGQRLCETAGDPLDAHIGCSLFQALREWADDRRVDVRALLVKHLPSRENVLRIMAADAVCRSERAALLRTPDEAKLREKLGRQSGLTGDALARRVEEEIAGVRRLLTDTVLAAKERIGDLPRFRQLFDEMRSRALRDGLMMAKSAAVLPAFVYTGYLERHAALSAYVQHR
jgi:hypothetical protein